MEAADRNWNILAVAGDGRFGSAVLADSEWQTFYNKFCIVVLTLYFFS